MTSQKDEGVDRVPSGIKGLDEILQGGFIKGGLYIIEGAPGTGKTIFGNQICFNQIKSGKSILYVTLIAETVARMMVNLRNLQFFDESAVGAGIFYISAFSALKNEGLTGLLHLLRREVAARRASIVIVDGFASASDSAAKPEELKVFVQQLQTQADAADCTVFLLTNPAEARPSSEETMVDGIINLGTSLQASSAMRELYVRKFRGSAYREGIHNFEIDEDGITVYPRMETLVTVAPAPRQHSDRTGSGVAYLDAMLGGGFPRGSITMLIGPSGTGKTTMGLQFLAQSSASEPGLLFGFYETPARIEVKARIFPSFRQALESGHLEISWQPPAERLLDKLADHILAAVRRRKVRRLLIDGLAGFRKALRSRPMEPFFAALAEELRAADVTAVCTAEVVEIMGPTITTPLAGLSDVTDNHILLRFIETGASLYRLLSILKVRDSGFDSSLRQFSITDNGIQLAPDSQSAELILSSIISRGRQAELIVTEK
jgi:circadian clock protein KaiC